MGLRLILVGMVAGLGLTLPTWTQLSVWRESAQAWVNRRLAEWDARMPADENAFVYVADTIERSTVEPSTGPVAEPAKFDRGPVTAATPVADAVEAASGKKPASNLARSGSADVLDVPSQPVALDESELLTIEPAAPVALRVPPPASVHGPTGLPPQVVVDEDEAFQSAQLDVLAGFAAELTAPSRANDAPIVANGPAPAPGEPFDPIEVGEDLDSGLAYELNRESEGLNVTLLIAERRVSAKSAKSEPIEIAEDLYLGIAYELNRGAEGLDLPAEQARAEKTSTQFEDLARTPTETPFIHAVRLTREAVFAWANLLHGPAVVTIAH
jgi:hypothetical protein